MEIGDSFMDILHHNTIAQGLEVFAYVVPRWTLAAHLSALDGTPHHHHHYDFATQHTLFLQQRVLELSIDIFNHKSVFASCLRGENNTTAVFESELLSFAESLKNLEIYFVAPSRAH
jgi:hypothetical protein